MAEEREYVRDEQGRFAETGGAGGAKEGEKASVATSLGQGLRAFANKPSRAEKAQQRFPTRKVSDERPAHLPADTLKHHTDASGKLSPERQKLHDELVGKMVNHVPIVPKGEQKHAIMTMGGPGSGKSVGLSFVDKSQFVHVDPDDVKGKIPEYKDATKTGHTYTGAAAMVHEESSHIADRAAKEAIDSGRHVIIDGTGKTLKNYVDKMQSLHAAGYQVHVLFSHATHEAVAPRIDIRAQQVGRYVPHEVVKGAYDKIPKNASAIMEAVKKMGGSMHVVDNTGDKPRLVWSMNKGQETHHDPEWVKAFKAKHG